MNRVSIKGVSLIFVALFWAFLSIHAGESNASPPYLYTDQELDDLLAPIALYPDPLLAQMLPASTYPEEIEDVYAWLSSGGALQSIEWQSWDESVKAIAHYPSILEMMVEDMDWTADIGDAFLNQPEDVTSSIQRLRWQARAASNLESNSQQTVVIIGNYIEIIPAQPYYVYVPQYDPSVVYIQRHVPSELPFITFGIGLALGGWLTMDFDWDHRHVIHHGWNRPGWVNRVKPHVHIEKVYVNRSRPHITQTWRHDASHGSPERYRALHPRSDSHDLRNARMPEIRGSAAKPKRSTTVFSPKGAAHSFSNRGKESHGIISSPPTKSPQDSGKGPAKPDQRENEKIVKPTAPDIAKQKVQKNLDIDKRQPQPTPGTSKQSLPLAQHTGKGLLPRLTDKSAQPAKTPSVTFGGYRGNNEARSQSLRGKASRQSNGRMHPSDFVSKDKPPEDKGKESVKGGTSAGTDDKRGRMRR